MSGGALNYFCHHLEEHVGDFGDAELDNLVKDLAHLFHIREWYLSGDMSEGEWNRNRDEFKVKWLTAEGRQERIKSYLDACVEEMRCLVDVSCRRYCLSCTHWNKSPRVNGYGKCDYQSSCLTHGYENACEKYEKKT